MAKLGLIFIAICLIIQIAYAANIRVARDAPTTATGGSQDLTDTLNKALESIKKGFDETFTKENLDKLSKQLSDAGEKTLAVAKDLAAKGQEKFTEITEKKN